MSLIAEPKQDRSRQTRQRLINALTDIVREREFRDIAVVDIAQAANVAVGTVYRHFANKDDFLNTLLKQRIAVLRERLTIEVSPIPDDWRLRDILENVVAQSLIQIEDDAPIIRTLLTHEPIDPVLHAAMADLQERALQRVVGFLTACGERVKHQDIERAARQIFHILNTLFIDDILGRGGPLYWSEAPPRKALITETALMLTCYLQGDGT